MRASGVCLFLFCVTVLADLPNHCLHSQVVGTWALYLSNPSYNKDTAFSQCVHRFEPASIKTVQLKDPESQGPIATSAGVNSGKWTMIYDEGFEITLDNTKYFAFSRYDYPPKTGFSFITSLVSETAVSDCSRTFPGTYHQTGVGGGGQWGCFVAKKISGNFMDLEQTSSAIPKLSPEDFKIPIAPNSRRKDNFDEDRNGVVTMLQEREQAYVDHINSVQSSWQAGLYDEASMKELYNMFVSGGPAADQSVRGTQPLGTVNASSTVEQQALAQMNAETGKDEAEKVPETAAVQAAATAESKDFPWSVFGVTQVDPKVAELQKQANIQLQQYPSSLDWRNHNGKNYVTSVKKQDDRSNGYGCGSCYAVAVLSALESRIRIKSDLRHQPNLSIQDIVSCSPYAQGCDGGFPYLVGKHLEDYGVAETECMPYQLSRYYEVSPSISDYLLGDTAVCEKASKCSNYKNQRWYATNYHYVGGYYGACDELGMVRELQDGPITVGFWASQDLVFYKSGIWHHISSPEVTSHNGAREWEKTNHAVMLVGYGEENGEKYWIAKNSWGETWGDHGFFKVRRGTDEGGFESMTSVISPVLNDGNKMAVSNIQQGPPQTNVPAAPAPAPVSPELNLEKVPVAAPSAVQPVMPEKDKVPVAMPEDKVPAVMPPPATEAAMPVMPAVVPATPISSALQPNFVPK